MSFAEIATSDLPRYSATAIFSALERLLASHFIRPLSSAPRIADRDISRRASGSGARMSLSSRWQPEHLARNRGAASMGGAAFLVQPGRAANRQTRTSVITARLCLSRAQLKVDNLKRRHHRSWDVLGAFSGIKCLHFSVQIPQQLSAITTRPSGVVDCGTDGIFAKFLSPLTSSTE